MSLKNYLRKDLVTCEPDTSIAEVASRMKDENIGSVLVVREGKPIGIVTDRDIVIRGLAEQQDISSLSVEDVMSEAVQKVSINDGIYDVVKCMKENEIRRVPVVDGKGKAVGLISYGDIMTLISKEIAELNSTTEPEEPKLMRKAG